MCELAVVNSRHGRLEQLAEQGQKGARAALALAENPKDFLARLQIGVTFTAIVAGTFSGATLAKTLDDLLLTYPVIAPYASAIAISVVVVTITYLTSRAAPCVGKEPARKPALQEIATGGELCWKLC